MDRRRFLLTVGANKWLTYPFEFLYHSLIPTQINGSKVQDKARLTKISGNGVVENQLVQELNSTNNSIGFWYGVHHTVSYSNNVATLTTTGANSGIDFGTNATISFVQGHKYLAIFNIKSSVAGRKVRPQLSANQAGEDVTLGTNNYIAQIISYSVASATSRFAILIFNSETNDTFEVSDMQLIDLTLMFGAGNEPTTLTDNRIQALLNRGYIPYNAGSYKNSRVGEIECEPYNLFDDEWEVGGINGSGVENTNSFNAKTGFIKISPSKNYSVENTTFTTDNSSSNIAVAEYDENKNFLRITNLYAANTGTYTLKYANSIFSYNASSDTHYIKVRLYIQNYDFNNNLPTGAFCIHLTGTRTGYAPYQAPTKITLNGLLELNGAINSHDTFEITKTDYVFTRSVWNVDLGSLTWSYNSQSGHERFISSSFVGKAPSDNAIVPNILCAKYLTVAANELYSNGSSVKDMTLYSSNHLQVSDNSYNDANTFKSAMSGITLYYELALPQVISIPRKHLGCYTFKGNEYVSVVNTNSQNIVSVLINVAYYSNVDGTENNKVYLYNALTRTYQSAVYNESNSLYFNGTRLVINLGKTTAEDTLKELIGKTIFYETDAEVSDFDNIAQINAGGSINANEFSANFDQVIENGNFADTSAWSFASGDSGNTFTAGSNVGIIKMYSYGDATIFRQQYTPISGHKYLLIADYRVDSSTRNFKWVLGSNSIDFLLATTSWQTLVNIGTRTDANPTFGISLTVSLTTTFRLRNVKYIDLTETFGAGNEPTSENDYRVQYILNGGSLDAIVETEVLPNVNFKIKCK